MAIACALLVVLVGAGLGVGWPWFVDRPGPERGTPVAVSWPEGLDAREAARLLADLELTDSATAMELVLRATSAPDCFVAGPHLLSDAATPRQLVAMLCRAAEREIVKVTIPEGFNRFAIATRLEKLGVAARDAFVHSSEDRDVLAALGIEPAEQAEGDTAEGYLFPATYDFHVDSDPRDVVRRLTEEGDQRWMALRERHAGGWQRLQNVLGLDRRGALTLASMVEKEAVVDEERPLIASVFINRLQSTDLPRLQSDPTAIYGCYALPDRIESCRDFDGKATPALLRDADNVFSTYVIEGLPPGPIASPGEASIAAVLAPADSSYFYFVAKGHGRHTFSTTYEEHLAAVERLRDMRSR